MGYRLLALDIDGTLLTSRHTISKKTIAAIEEARKRGLIITLATGRNYPNTKKVVQKLKINVPIISNDGAYIVNPVNNSVLYEKRMDKEIIPEIVLKLNQCGLRYLLHYEAYNLTYRKMRWPGLFGWANKRAFGLMLYERGTCKIIPENNILRFMDENRIVPFKISILSDAGFLGQMCDVKEIFAAEFGEKIDISGSGHEGFEILPKGMSKAKGLEILSRELELDKSEIIAIGDSFNDAEMIKYAGLGIAMGNAPEDIQKLAGFVTKSNDENGVAYAIERTYLNAKL